MHKKATDRLPAPRIRGTVEVKSGSEVDQLVAEFRSWIERNLGQKPDPQKLRAVLHVASMATNPKVLDRILKNRMSNVHGDVQSVVGEASDSVNHNPAINEPGPLHEEFCAWLLSHGKAVQNIILPLANYPLGTKFTPAQITEFSGLNSPGHLHVFVARNDFLFQGFPFRLVKETRTYTPGGQKKGAAWTYYSLQYIGKAR